MIHVVLGWGGGLRRSLCLGQCRRRWLRVGLSVCTRSHVYLDTYVSVLSQLRALHRRGAAAGPCTGQTHRFCASCLWGSCLRC